MDISTTAARDMIVPNPAIKISRQIIIGTTGTDEDGDDRCTGKCVSSELEAPSAAAHGGWQCQEINCSQALRSEMREGALRNMIVPRSEALCTRCFVRWTNTGHVMLKNHQTLRTRGKQRELEHKHIKRKAKLKNKHHEHCLCDKCPAGLRRHELTGDNGAMGQSSSADTG